jgi:hypothetical protein
MMYLMGVVALAHLTAMTPLISNAAKHMPKDSAVTTFVAAFRPDCAAIDA